MRGLYPQLTIKSKVYLEMKTYAPGSDRAAAARRKVL